MPTFNDALRFRLQAALMLTVVGTACGATIETEDGGSGGGEAGGNAGGGNEGGFNAGGGNNSGGFVADGGGNTGGAPPTTKACLEVMPPPMSEVDCLGPDAALPFLPTNICGIPPSSVSLPSVQDGLCCYSFVESSEDQCGVGRPFVVAGKKAVAKVGSAASSWSEAATPSLAGLSAEDRRELAQAWLSDALLEHASVASFGRFALELLAVGAPDDLVADAHRAALDEVQHAKLCFALASTYANTALRPAKFAMGGALEVREDLAEIARAVVREGCIGETLAAAQAAFQLETASDPAVRAALATIVEDESRHAELAWRTLVWLLQEGGDAVRMAAREAFAQPLSSLTDSTWACAAHGRPPAAEIEKALAEAHRLVVKPVAAGLLA